MMYLIQFFIISDYLLSSDCLNDESWCDEAGPDCTRDFTKTHCRHYCQLCLGENSFYFVYLLSLVKIYFDD